jgi:hypothetical protein
MTRRRRFPEKMFDAAEVRASIREEYWADLEKMKAKLKSTMRPDA